MILNDINIYVLIIIIVIPATLLVIIFFKYFESTIFVILLSPMISALFVPNISSTEIESDVGLGSYIRISIVALIGLVSVIKVIMLWNRRRFYLTNPIILVFVIILLAFYSSTYSIDQNITLIRTTTFFFIILFCLAFYYWVQTKKDYIKILDMMFYLSILFIFLNLIALFFFPSKAWWITDTSRFQGFLDQPNSLGADSSIFFILSLWKISVSKRNIEKISIYVLIIILILFIFLSGSRTSIITTFLGFCLWLILNKKNVKLMLFLLLLSLGFLFFSELKPSNIMRADTDNVTDLTGRDQFWIGSILLISERPLQGYGFEVAGMIWQDPRFNDPNLTLWSGSSRQSLHNGYISVAIGLGLPGFIIWMITILFPFVKLHKYTLTREIKVFLIFGIIFFITNFIETTIAAGSILFWLTWTMLISFLRKETWS